LKLKAAKNYEPSKSRSAYIVDPNESEEVQQMRIENQKLSEEIAMLEQRDAEINEQVRAMSEQAEQSLAMRQHQRRDDPNEMNS
jgi:proteasome assembly chaperone (PAC2) family protein